MKNVRRTLYLILATLLVTGCQNAPKNYWYGKTSNIDMTVGIAQREDVTDRKTAEIHAQLNLIGVDILSVGQDYRVIIPVEHLFYYETPRLMWDSFHMVNLVGEYLKQFRLVSVRINAYSHGPDRKQSGALSYARARAVADYLWSQNIGARMIYTQAHSMDNNPNACCSSSNASTDVPAHIELTFRNPIV